MALLLFQKRSQDCGHFRSGRSVGSVSAATARLFVDFLNRFVMNLLTSVVRMKLKMLCCVLLMYLLQCKINFLRQQLQY